jgi:hypothetical protein
VEIQAGSSTREISVDIHQKQKVDPLYDPYMPLLGISPNVCKSTCKRGVYQRTSHNSHIWKQLRYATCDGWIKKMWYIYTIGYCSAIKKNEIRSYAGNGWK